MAANFGFHLNEVWKAKTSGGQSVSTSQAITLATGAGGDVIRYDMNWADIQWITNVTSLTAPSAFNAQSNTLTAAAFDTYLQNRGYGTGGSRLDSYFVDLAQSASLGMKTVLNLNTAPEWAKPDPANVAPKIFYGPGPDDFYWNAQSEKLNDNRSFSEFLYDFIIYASRQNANGTTAAGPTTHGINVLKSITAFQIYNEVGGFTLEYNPGYGFANIAWGYAQDRQLSYKEYFEILDHATAKVELALNAINWAAQSGNAPRPEVSGPNLAGAYNPAFWNELFRYTPLNVESTNAAGRLELTTVSLHPYGITVRPDVDVILEDQKNPNYDNNNAWQDVSNNITYQRIMMPGDDKLYMDSMIGRSLSNRPHGKSTAMQTPVP
jgi:hypothetical protein